MGFSLNYPDPQKRFGGDIDVFTFKHGTDFSKPENNMTHKFDTLFEKLGTEIKDVNPKHSGFKYKGMPIENHRTFLDVDSKYVKVPDAEKMNTYLMKHLSPKQKVLPMGTKILVPSKEFNTVFMAYHSMTHFIGGGINFHHLADWAVLIHKFGLNIPQEVNGTALEKFMYAMTNLSNKYLGTKVNVPENKKLEDAVFDKILDPTNKYNDRNIPKPNTKNPLKILNYKYAKLKAEAKFKATLPEIFGEQKSSVSNRIINRAKFYLCHPHKIGNLLFKFA